MSKYLYDDEDNAPMIEEQIPFAEPLEKGENCHQYCPYAKRCRYADGAPGLEPENCDMYYKLDAVIKGEKHG